MMIQTTVGVPMDAMVLNNYFRTLINLFFKILPIKESGESSLDTYMRSLQAELLGCKELIEAIHEDPLFLSLIAILQYLIMTQHTQIGHVTSLARIEENKYVRLDKFTVRSLELMGSMNDGCLLYTSDAADD